MLFNFGKFWKVISSLVVFWVMYGLCGFEFTTITLLSLILVSKIADTTKIF
mgnify:CR=1 FL=1